LLLHSTDSGGIGRSIGAQTSTSACHPSEISVILLLIKIVVMRAAHPTNMATTVLEHIHRYQLILSIGSRGTRLVFKPKVCDFRKKTLRVFEDWWVWINLELLVIQKVYTCSYQLLVLVFR